MSVARICQRDVDVAAPEENCQCAAERMRQRTVGCLVVVEEGEVPVGILTDRDLVLHVLADGRDPLATRVEEVMTKLPHLASDEMPIETALGLMRRGGFRRLPVIDRNGRLSGLITLDDILMLVAEEFLEIGSLLEGETPQAVTVRG